MPVVVQPRQLNPKKMATVLVVLAFAFYFYYQREPTYQFWKLSGETMGTTYTVKLLDRHLSQVKASALKSDIDEALIQINRQMSTYITNSEITVFNDSRDTSSKKVSAGFAYVTKTAIEICDQTGGAFDPALDPLINAWGFGHQGPQQQPTAEELERARALSGCDKIIVDENGMLGKSDPEVRLNLNAIAKGFGVDQIGGIIEKHGITNYMVEIGGEVFARGLSEKMRPWRIGIDRPVDGSIPGETVDIVVQVDGVGLASSGSYRNFVMNDQGVKVAHLFDPRSGQPVMSSLASVSVIAPDCMTADALATALFVMGVEEGIAWVNQHAGINAAFIEYDDDGLLKTTFSQNFETYLFTESP